MQKINHCSLDFLCIAILIRNPPQCNEEKVVNLSMCVCTSNHLIYPTTKDTIPMSICAGKRMVCDDWCFCLISGFPALLSEHIKLIKASDEDAVQAKDPVFGHEISLESLKQVSIILLLFCNHSLHIRISL